jgi:hypothetical protein
MNCKLILFLCVTAISGAETFAIVPKFAVGQQFKIEITKTREDTGRSRGGGSKSDVLMKVIEVNEQGAIAEWVVKDTQFLMEVPAALKGMVEASAKVVKGLPFELQFDKEGAFTGLRNADEVNSRLMSMVKVLIGELTKELPDEAMKQAFAKQVGPILNPAFVIGSATREIQLLFNLSGAELDTGERLVVNLEAPNPLGGDTKLPSVFEVLLEKIAGGEAYVTTVQKHDPGAARAMVTALTGKAPPEGEMPAVELIDTGEFVFDASTKLAKRIHHVRKISVGPQHRTDTIDIIVTIQ